MISDPDAGEDHDDAASDQLGRGTRPASSQRRNTAAFARLIEAEARLYGWWEQRHPATTWVSELLGSPVEDTTELWIAALGEKVAAMGGHLELTAVFDNETLTLLGEPGPDPQQT
jgi:hypothetical protein